MTVTRLPDEDDIGVRMRPPRRLDHVVVGVDFAEPSLAAAAWVGRYLAQSARLTLVHVTPLLSPPNVSRVGHQATPIEGRPSADRMRSLRGALRGLAGLTGANRTAVVVRVGDAATQLAAYADLVGADLIVIGGSSAYHVAPTDATTEQLRRLTRRPVLLARSVREAPRTVLATAVSDAAAASVLAAARMVARPCAARVLWFQPTDRASTGASQGERGDRAAAAAYPAPELVDGEVSRARAILDAADRLRADIIAIGGHAPPNDVASIEGREDPVRTLVRVATCSVLVVPDDSADPPPSRSRSESHSSLGSGLAAGGRFDRSHTPALYSAPHGSLHAGERTGERG
jgi:nucleotide-binding universal stress UspA family protein